MTNTGYHEAAEEVGPQSPGFAKRFGAFLIEAGFLTDLPLRRAQRAQSQSGERFDLVLTRLGLMSDVELARALAEFLQLPLLTTEDLPKTSLFEQDLNPAFLSSARLVPVSDDGSRVLLAMADPYNADAIAALSFQLDRKIDRGLATPGDIAAAIAKLYGKETGIPARSGVPDIDGPEESANEDDIRRLEDLASEAPIIRLVHDLIAKAASSRASDIHFEPRSDCMEVRFRIDGILHTAESLPPSVTAAVTSRLKIMARLNIAERRLPQDGRIKATVQGREIDLRVSTMPTMGGESIVLRLLDRSTVNLDFAELGLNEHTRYMFTEILREPHGIILVTGPTGSGKTTTLYTALSLLNSTERKTFTVEDPIEYELPGVNQIQVQPKIGLTFANTLRSILRQDPDVVMVGEIRDLETAQVAIQASLTGHLVLSTVHTNSAAATIARLLDMGVETYLLASSLKGVLAQRLVRCLCAECAKPVEPTPVLVDCLKRAGLADELPSNAHLLRAPVGCGSCRQTGFDGRTMVCEFLKMGGPIQTRILNDGTEHGIGVVMRETGMASMFVDGLKKVLVGETTLEEVLRVTRMDP